MKLIKRVMNLLPVLLVLFVFVLTGCSHSAKTEVEKVISNELDMLKNLDSETAQKYISYKELFPDALEGTPLSDEIKEVFSLFFRDFDYEILDISVDKEKANATASLKLSTIDARALAKDFAAALLKKEILETAGGSTKKTGEASASPEDHYLLLNHLLKTKEYDTAETDCAMQLTRSGKKGGWNIKRTYSLENYLVGGLMAYLSEPDILSPEDTLAVCLNTLKKMDVNQMSRYLGITSLMNTDDKSKNSIAAALVEQVHKNFNYLIRNSAPDGSRAVVRTEITTFDSGAILAEHRDRLAQYLASPDALIDGSEKRYEKTFELLLDCIKNNEKTDTAEVDFTLINDGVSWKLEDAGTALGDAIFGTLTTVEEGSGYDSGDSGYDAEYNYEYDSEYDSEYNSEYNSEDSEYSEEEYSDNEM